MTHVKEEDPWYQDNDVDSPRRPLRELPPLNEEKETSDYEMIELSSGDESPPKKKQRPEKREPTSPSPTRRPLEEDTGEAKEDEAEEDEEEDDEEEDDGAAPDVEDLRKKHDEPVHYSTTFLSNEDIVRLLLPKVQSAPDVPEEKVAEKAPKFVCLQKLKAVCYVVERNQKTELDLTVGKRGKHVFDLFGSGNSATRLINIYLDKEKRLVKVVQKKSDKEPGDPSYQLQVRTKCHLYFMRSQKHNAVGSSPPLILRISRNIAGLLFLVLWCFADLLLCFAALLCCSALLIC